MAAKFLYNNHARNIPTGIKNETRKARNLNMFFVLSKFRAFVMNLIFYGFPRDRISRNDLKVKH